MYVYSVSAEHGGHCCSLYLLRIGPKCKKMQDLRPNSVFKASAFMPSEAEIRAACRAAKDRARSAPAKRRKLEIIDLSDSSESDSDSDDGMPDLSKLLKSSPMDAKKGTKKAKPADSDSDSDSDSYAPRKNDKRGKGKAKMDEDDEEPPPPPPDPNQYNVWMEGGNNVESSAKMTQMIAYLKEWECTGDKTIVFSQCECGSLLCARRH